MKIAFIGHKRVPSNEGGIEKCVEQQAIRLKKRGWEPVLYNRSRGSILGNAYGRGSELTEYRGMRIVNVPAPGGPFGVPLYAFLSTVHAAASHTDLLFYHASGPCNMIRVAKLLGIPCAGMLHGLDSKRAKWGGFASKYLARGEKAAAQKADKCFVLSEEMKRFLEEEYAADPVVINNGIDMPAAKNREQNGDADAADDAGLLNDKFGLTGGGYILTACRIVPEKGLHDLITAFRKCDTDKKLVIAGGVTKECRVYYEELLELAAGDERIMFIGHQTNETLDVLYDNAYIFVLASSLEGMALALLEAMSHGCCCLVSDIEENTTVTGDAAVSFAQGDTDDLALKMQSLLDDPARVSETGAKAAPRVEENYSWDSCVDKLDEMFREILTERKLDTVLA